MSVPPPIAVVPPTAIPSNTNYSQAISLLTSYMNQYIKQLSDLNVQLTETKNAITCCNTYITQCQATIKQLQGK